MDRDDVSILLKKAGVNILIILFPLVMIIGSLWLTRHFLSPRQPADITEGAQR